MSHKKAEVVKTNTGDNQGEKQIDWHWVLTSCPHQAFLWTMGMKRWMRLDPYFLSVLPLLFPRVQVGLCIKHTFLEYFSEESSKKWIWLRNTWSGGWKAKQEATVSEYPWEAEGLAERYSWKWEMKMMRKALGKGPITPVVLITPNSSVDVWHHVGLCKGFTKNQAYPGTTWLVVHGRWSNKCLDYYISLRGCKCTKLSMNRLYYQE